MKCELFNVELSYIGKVNVRKVANKEFAYTYHSSRIHRIL